MKRAWALGLGFAGAGLAAVVAGLWWWLADSPPGIEDEARARNAELRLAAWRAAGLEPIRGDAWLAATSSGPVGSRVDDPRGPGVVVGYEMSREAPGHAPVERLGRAQDGSLWVVEEHTETVETWSVQRRVGCGGPGSGLAFGSFVLVQALPSGDAGVAGIRQLTVPTIHVNVREWTLPGLCPEQGPVP